MPLPAYNQQMQQRSENVTYACTALLGSNKSGIIKPDANGYYKLVLGAFDVFNSKGQFYPLTSSVKALFEQSGSLQRRIADGALRGEYGHPRPWPGMKPSEYLERILDILESNVCCHFKSITLDFNNIRDRNGTSVVSVIGEVKPAGPNGPSLKSSLDSPDENVCFSIRSLTDNVMIGGVVQRHVRTAVTWDYVNEPGLLVARKWQAPGLESAAKELEEYKISPAALRMVVDNTRGSRVGMESTHQLAVDLAHALGWDHKDPKSPIVLPRDMGW